MTRYVAFLRAIMPQMNPLHKTENLRKIFEELGFENVTSYFASGNIIFDSSENKSILEEKIEEALLKKAGSDTPTILRTKEELEELLKRNPFKNVKTTSTIKPHVTFLKDTSKESEVCYVVDISQTTTPKLMRDLEKKYGKQVTTRTWNTVERVLKIMK